MKKILCPSMMCADFGHLNDEIRQLEDAEIDIFHLDVMDGCFVPNYGMGLQDIEYICRIAKKPCDVHLMIDNPEKYVGMFAKLGAQIIYVHYESSQQITKTLQMIKDEGVHPGIAINPGTSFETVKDVLYLVDYVLIMTVNPGFAGQKYLDFVTTKIHSFVRESKRYGGYKVIVDGACSPNIIKNLSMKGVDGFVLGTSALFKKEKNYKTIIKKLADL